MNHASPVSFRRVSLAAGLGVATMVMAAACGSNGTPPANTFGNGNGGNGGYGSDATASSSGGGNGSSSSSYNNGGSSNGGGTDNSSSGAASSSGGTTCTTQCHADTDCQSCPAPDSGTWCCDQSSNTCFMSANAQCTPQQVGSE